MSLFGGKKPASGATPGVDRRRQDSEVWMASEHRKQGAAANISHTPPAALTARLNIYFLRHIQVFFYALGQIYQSLFSSTLTVMVIAISLALPAGLNVIFKNVKVLSGSWDSGAQVSLFIRSEISEDRVVQLRDELARRPDVASVRYISREQGLEEFRRYSGFGEVLKGLADNPIPAVLVIQPAQTATHSVRQLAATLEALPPVEFAKLDMEWLQRMNALMDIGHRGITLLGAVLALAVVLIVSNTIRLMIQNRREEIEITKLFGGTNAFIRRPFLYSGLLHGLLGGIVSWLLINLLLTLMNTPIQQLAQLYDSTFTLLGLGLRDSLVLIGGSALLGYCGAHVAVGRHLREIEPR